MTKEAVKENSRVFSEGSSVKRYAAAAFSVAATVLAFAIAITGSVFADINLSAESSGEENTETVASGAYLPEEKTQMLDGFEKAIGELDARVTEIDAEIKSLENTENPEERIYVKGLYDEKASLLIKKAERCIEYSAMCISFAEETRLLLAEPIAEYEKYHAEYKGRLSAVYENGFPDMSEVLGTSGSIMDFVMGGVMLDEVRDYDKDLYNKVCLLYADVEDGLGAVKYYLARSEEYSELGKASVKSLADCVNEGAEYFRVSCINRDTYSYFLQKVSENEQRFSALLSEYSSDSAAPKLAFPLDSEYFYTDYIGRGHESRYEYSPALGSYVNLFHSGIELLTHGSYAPVKAAADGQVIFADYIPTKGYTVAILHSGGIVTVYSSCGALDCASLDEVKTGDIIAFSGMSGDAKEFLVNFEIFEKGAFTDPDKYLEMPDVSVSDNQK